MLTVWRSDSSRQDHHIHHNLFKDYVSGNGENGWETIRVGTSHQSQSDSYTIIENNRFENCDGEIETISIKSGRNTIRGNTFIASEGHLTLRHGKYNRVEDNVFLLEGKKNGGGIRIYDEHHVIYNNYIEGVDTSSNMRGGIVIHSGINAPGESTTLNDQWTAADVTISNNTLVDSRQSFVYSGKINSGGTGYAPERISLSNNVVSAGSYAVVREDASLLSSSYSGELYHGSSLGLGSRPAGVTFGSVSLQPDSQGLQLHASKGAQDLKVMQTDEVGPQSY